MSLGKVFVSREIPESGLQKLREQCDCTVWPHQRPPSAEEFLQHAQGCDGLLTLLSDRVDLAVLDAVGPQLKVVSNFAVGYNNIDVSTASQRGIRVGNTPDVLTDATADIAVALLLAASRHFKEGSAAVGNGGWKTWEPLGYIGPDLKGKTLGIVGMGRIGFATAKRLHGGWNMKVLYTSRSPKPDADRELKAEKVELDRLLAESDFISLHTPLSPETSQLFNAAAFEKMKPTAVLVNTARGGVVDQTALHDALTSPEGIFAAGLDVTDPEPLPLDNSLIGLPNCFIMPHVGSATVTSRNEMSEIAAQNVLRGLRGESLLHEVTS